MNPTILGIIGPGFLNPVPTLKLSPASKSRSQNLGAETLIRP